MPRNPIFVSLFYTPKHRKEMTLEEIKAKVTAFLETELEIDPSLIQDEALLKDDMGIDSLEVVDVIVLVEEEFGFKMKPEDFKELKTLNQFCQHIREHVA